MWWLFDEALTARLITSVKWIRMDLLFFSWFLVPHSNLHEHQYSHLAQTLKTSVLFTTQKHKHAPEKQPLDQDYYCTFLITRPWNHVECVRSQSWSRRRHPPAITSSILHSAPVSHQHADWKDFISAHFLILEYENVSLILGFSVNLSLNIKSASEINPRTRCLFSILQEKQCCGCVDGFCKDTFI